MLSRLGHDVPEVEIPDIRGVERHELAAKADYPVGVACDCGRKVIEPQRIDVTRVTSRAALGVSPQQRLGWGSAVDLQWRAAILVP